MGRNEDYDGVDHIFRGVTKLRALDTARLYFDRDLSNEALLEDLNQGLYVSRCVCKGENGAVTEWRRESERELKKRKRALKWI